MRLQDLLHECIIGLLANLDLEKIRKITTMIYRDLEYVQEKEKVAFNMFIALYKL
ncbi:hypothetical protein CC80DRAFT_421632 [Byssothecium circinans]|uniref:Uncharacterized protein n=1 Tax=Byssothecium circinans TaxID=147558 RepID=A0A6A5TIS7_9PLEO|nr:hypothetical protein CC80DRAFT_421632 [Byssothecium circinans]